MHFEYSSLEENVLKVDNYEKKNNNNKYLKLNEQLNEWH